MEAIPIGAGGVLVLGAIGLFWVGMLGLLWRRSLVGMLVGLLFAWSSVALAGAGQMLLQSDSRATALGGVLVLCVAVLGGMQVAVGLGLVVARVRRRGSPDADEAGLLEG